MFGVALAAMMTMNFCFSPFWGKLCGYIPTNRIMLICGIGYAIGQMIFGAAQSELMVVGGRMFAGIFTGGYAGTLNCEHIQQWIEMGYTMFFTGSDCGMVFNGATAMLRDFNNAFRKED